MNVPNKMLMTTNHFAFLIPIVPRGSINNNVSDMSYFISVNSNKTKALMSEWL